MFYIMNVSEEIRMLAYILQTEEKLNSKQIIYCKLFSQFYLSGTQNFLLISDILTGPAGSNVEWKIPIHQESDCN